MRAIYSLALAAIIAFTGFDASAQSQSDNLPLGAFSFRNVGPGFLSGRIADIAVHPQDENMWYVAVGSGGVWKTVNAGTTWQPLFDGQSSYSTGCIAIDPNNHSVIWVGTGENVGGRHVGYGDGIYRSQDGGASWQNMGLKETQHISEIIIHPSNSQVMWVAAQGPLWNSGGERGVYKTTDGGATWKQVLGNDEWTGATDIMLDPRNPDVIYAATWDRHRTVAALMDGGPGTGIHRSDDGGETWTALKKGLPGSNKGKIGLAISPQNPDVVYAAIELDRISGAVYRSDNRGASWQKMSNTVAGGTGPHYYQELYASPHEFDKIYLMNVRVLMSKDGGRSFETVRHNQKHSDNHAMIFRQDDPDYIMLGTDAGIYESFDDAATWKYHKNLPLTQFYKVAVNDAKPFYHIFGGTQDNGSVGGPSATDEREGIANRHWYKTLFADGHQSATDPVYNNIVYAETQEGGLHRVDLVSGDKVFIQPQAGLGEPHERFNWDAPILVSPHDPARLYFASYRVWRSDNRGDSWKTVSEDLTRNENRLELPIMGGKQSWDNAWDVYAMSNYNTITSLSESPVQEGLLYAGTDDGYIAVSENGGESWKRIPVTKLGLPERSFVNDIKADLHDANTVYVVLDNHKEGDFNPYIYKSTNRGKTWKSIASNLPERTLTWRLVQDHVSPDLMFAATEFGVYVTLNGGGHWQKLGGTPNTSFRDLVIQKRENDLVAASFGRGFFVLDDYSALRTLSAEVEEGKPALFAPRNAKWYMPTSRVGNTGGDYYFAKNPEFGAVFTYYLSDEYTTAKKQRQAAEKKLIKEGKDIPFPGYEALDAETREKGAQVLIAIHDNEGNIVRYLRKPASKGTHRIAWDLRHVSTRAIAPSGSGDGQSTSPAGPMATPGKYYATLAIEQDGVTTSTGETVHFEVAPIREGTLKGVSYAEFDAFRKELDALRRAGEKVGDRLNRAEKVLNACEKALYRTDGDVTQLAAELKAAQDQLNVIKDKLNGSPSRNDIGEKNPQSIWGHFYAASRGLGTTYGPTGMHQRSLDMAKRMLDGITAEVIALSDVTVPALLTQLEALNAPYIQGE